MMTKRNTLLILLLILFLGSTIYFGWPKSKQPAIPSPSGNNCINGYGEVQANPGYCAPNFTLNRTDGKKVELYKNQGKPSIINFWATWCGPCREEMPFFQKAYDQYKDKINFLMVNETSLEEDEEDVYNFMKKNNYTFPVLLDKVSNSSEGVGISKYGVVGVPMSFIIDHNGKVLQKKIGSFRESELDQLLKSALTST